MVPAWYTLSMGMITCTALGGIMAHTLLDSASTNIAAYVASHLCVYIVFIVCLFLAAFCRSTNVHRPPDSINVKNSIEKLNIIVACRTTLSFSEKFTTTDQIVRFFLDQIAERLRCAYIMRHTFTTFQFPSLVQDKTYDHEEVYVQITKILSTVTRVEHFTVVQDSGVVYSCKFHFLQHA